MDINTNGDVAYENAFFKFEKVVKTDSQLEHVKSVEGDWGRTIIVLKML